MKKYLLLATILIVSVACTQVLRKDLMETGIRDVPFDNLLKNPETFKGKLYILGGIVINTKGTEGGSMVEALYVSVDSRGYFTDAQTYSQRYLAFYPGKKGFLDPVVYKKESSITLAGVFKGIEKGKVDNAEYTYPLFEIEQIYLWKPAPLMPPHMRGMPYPYRHPYFWYYPDYYW
jgi:outer membrane lipoprotein